MNRSRVTGDLTASGLLYADIANDRVGIGSTIPGNKLSLPDNAKIGLGNAEDLEIFHNGSHNIIKSNNGDLYLQDDSYIEIGHPNGTVAAGFIPTGAVNLRHNGSIKLATASTGLTVTGRVDPAADSTHDLGTTSVRWRNVYGDTYYGDGSNLTGIVADKIFEGNTEVETVDTGSNGHVKITTEGTERLRITGDGPHLLLGGTADVNEITESASNTGMVIGSTSVGNGGIAIINSTSGTGRIYFGDATGNNAARNRGQINYYHNGDYMMLATAGAERLRIDSSGKVLIGRTSSSYGGCVIAAQAPSGQAAALLLHRGSNASNADVLGIIHFNDQNDYTGCQIRATANENWSGSAHGSYLSFYTTDNTTTTNDERLRITSAGKVGINETSPNRQLHVHDDTQYKGIFINGSDVPRIAFARNTTTTGEWSVGIDGTNGNQFAINNSDGNSNRKVIISSSEISLLSNTSVSGDFTIDDKIIHSGDTNTAIRFPAADTFSVETAGAERLRIASDGDLHIGANGGSRPDPTTSGFTVENNGKDVRWSNGGGTSGTTSSGLTIFGGGSSTNVMASTSWGGSIGLYNTNNTDGNSNCLAFGNSNQLATSFVIGETTSHSSRNGELVFATSSGAAPAERVRITSAGNIIPGTNNATNIGDGTTNFNSIWASTRFRGNDNVKLVLGNAQDLVIRHDGTDNLIESPTGDTLKIMMMGSSVDTADETAAKFIKDGAVELYHNNSKKFETLSSGVRVNDWDFTLKAGGGSEARLSVVGDNGTQNNDWSRLTAYNGVYKWQNMASGGWETMIEGNGDGNVELYHNNSMKLETTSQGIKVHGNNSAVLVQASSEVQMALGSTNAGGAAIYFDGDSNGDWSGSDYSWIRHTTDGDMEIVADNPSDDAHVFLKSKGGTYNAVNCWASGEVELRYQNTKRLETYSGGVIVGSSTNTDVNLRIDHENSGGIGRVEVNAHGSANVQLISNFSGSTVHGVPDDVFGLTTPHPYPINFCTHGTERFRITATGTFLHGSGAVATQKATNGGFDIACNNYSLIIGADSNSGSNTQARTDNAAKDGRIGHVHYHNSEEPIGIVRCYSDGANNYVYFGGGSSIFNAATMLSFYTATNDATTNGTERLRIGSQGQFGIGSNYGSSGQVMTSGGPSAAPSWQTPSAGVSVSANNTWSGTNTFNGTTNLQGSVYTDDNNHFQQQGYFTTATNNQNTNSSPGGYSFGYQMSGGWSHPYPDLILGYHTGIRIGAHKNYNGIRFYADHPGSTTDKLFSIGEGDGQTRCYNNFLPSSNGSFHLGSSSARWGIVYTSDLSLSNEASGPNDVDGTWGDWTLQEGENDIYMINNRTGKKFAINMREVT